LVPTASRYVATGDDRRLRELVVRGTRYTLALFVPVCVTLIVLAGPILDVWLGDRYSDGGAALAILVSYWLLYGGLVVTPGFLVGAGRAREVARIMVVAALANLALSLVLTPELGLEGPALGTAIPFFVAFPFLLRLGLSAAGVPLRQILGRAYLPALALGAGLALALGLARIALDPDTLIVVMALAVAGVAAYWAAFYGLVLEPVERVFVASFLRRRG
jgi:O-antigen/teichoic acid export membrane protein